MSDYDLISMQLILAAAYQPDFRQGMMQPGFGAPYFAPGQQEMMAQMMMMQANMAQMGEMMAQMAEVSSTAQPGNPAL